MPYGKGTYGSKVGRPPKKNKTAKKKETPMKTVKVSKRLPRAKTTRKR
jgi:hypothetical protein